MNISAVINTLNEEKNLERCLETLDWVDEIVVCDDGSTDKTIEIAQKFTDKIFYHRGKGYVEVARNFAIQKAQGNWILVVDADEEIPGSLAKKLQVLANGKQATAISHVLVPRKNIIFGKWIQHSGWWPDYNIRFFKKGKVRWSEKIHKDPETEGMSFSIRPDEDLAIVHHNYENISQFIDRMNRYTDIEVKELVASGYRFNWLDLFKKPNSEFLSRFFAQEGYKDGLHGFILAALQSFSFFVIYLKVWELQGAKEQDIDLSQLKKQSFEMLKEFKFWLFEAIASGKRGGEKLFFKLLKKL